MSAADLYALILLYAQNMRSEWIALRQHVAPVTKIKLVAHHLPLTLTYLCQKLFFSECYRLSWRHLFRLKMYILSAKCLAVFCCDSVCLED